MITGTLSDWATSLGVESRTLQRQLAKSGYEIKPKAKIPAKAIDVARIGEKAEAEIRLKMAQAIDQERKNKIAEGEMTTLAEYMEWQEKVCIPIANLLKSASATLSHLVSPSDPKHAKPIIDNWAEQGLAMLKTKTGQIITK